MGLIYAVIFCISLVALVKGADIFLNSAEKIGFAFRLSPFVIGVLLVGIGTSLPEVISSLFAVLFDVNTIVVANAIGSNITNILLVVALTTLVGGTILIKKDLIDIEIPFILATTALFIGMVYDGMITQFESSLLMGVFIIYIFYLLNDEKHLETIAGETDTKKGMGGIHTNDIIYFVIGIALILAGAHFLIQSIIQLSTIFNISEGLIAITAVAFGTSLPELIVSARAGLQGKGDIALGNIFGSNVFNLSLVVGLPGLFTTLMVDPKTLFIGLPTLILATLLIAFSAMSKHIYRWEGAMFLLGFVLFMKLLFT